MFKVAIQTISLALLLALLAGATPAIAQQHLSGAVGAEFGQYGFSNDIFSQDKQYESDRRLANEYLDLSMTGPLANSYFARYNAMLRLRATQVRSEVDGEATTDYINPKITNYYGALALFPNRAFPLNVYTGRSEENSVRYEAANRSETEILDAGLAVVRRYETINAETGALWRWALRSDLEVAAEFKTTANEMTRQYDFDENRNIWADFLTVSPGVAPYYNVDVVNTIPDHDVLVYVDFAFADTVKAGGIIHLVVEEGPRDIDFVPVGLNAFSHRLVMGSDMQWTIFFNDPPGSKDMDQRNNIMTGRLKYGKDGAFKSDAYFEYNDGNEEVQEMVTKLQTFNNLATYDFSRTASLSSLTTFSSNLTDVGVVSHQLSDMFLQQTTGKWRRNRGLSTMLSHSFAKMSSDTGADLVKSTNNIVTGNALLPTNWHGHEVGLRLIGNFLSDNKDYTNNMLSAELGNRLRFRAAGMRWEPKHALKSTKGESKNPDGSNSELDSKFALTGNHPNLLFLGNVRVKGQYDWRRKVNEKGTDIKNRYFVELGIIKKFSPRYKLMMSTSLDNESFDLLPNDQDVEVPVRDPETRKTLRLDLQTVPAEGVDIGFSGMWIATNESSIRKFSASLRLILPIIDLPIRSFVIKEYREMEGTRPQELLQMETKVSYNFRNIALVISHRLTDETLITEHYVYSEFLGKVSRNFDIF